MDPKVTQPEQLHHWATESLGSFMDSLLILILIIIRAVRLTKINRMSSWSCLAELLDWGWIGQGIVIRIAVRLRLSGLGLGGRLRGLGGPGGSASLRTETQCTTGIQASFCSLCAHGCGMTHQVHVCFTQNVKLTFWSAWARMDGFSHASGKNGPLVTVRPSVSGVMEGR